jgi:alkanesulfonate monooxygenase SsuD/methylene tetrahydromethanopterin reductase-like flavin-dependent oxidoreductase (luciferase family)
MVGAGAGYLEPEFEALGVPMERRGARLDDYIRAMRAIWTEDRPSYRGEFASFAAVNAYPRPIQQPLPIHIGGENPIAYRRAITMAQGWYGFALDLEETRACVDGIRLAAERHERPADLGDVELSVTPIGQFDRRSVDSYAALGIRRLVLLPQPDLDRARRHALVPVDDILRNIDLAGEIMARQ